MRKERLLVLLAGIVLFLTMFTIPAQAASLVVIATPDPEYVEEAGDIEISLSLENNGEFDLEELMLIAENGSETLLGTISAGAKRSFKVSQFPIEESDIGKSVKISFTWRENEEWQSYEHEIEIKEKLPEPKIDATVSVEPISARPGEEIEITYSIENTGETRINDIQIVDALFEDPIASGVSLREGRSESYSKKFTIEDQDVIIKPVVTGVDENDAEVRVEVLSKVVKLLNPSMKISLTIVSQSDVSATAEVLLVNDGNMTLERITLQDDIGTIIEDGLSLEAGEEVRYTFETGSIEEREVVLTATCFIAEEEDAIEFQSEGMQIAPMYTPDDISLIANAAVESATMDAPGEMSVILDIKNESPVPVYNIVISENGAGVLHEIERLDSQKEQQIELKVQIAQSGQLAFVLSYEDGEKRPYHTMIPEIDVSINEVETPAPSASPTPVAATTRVNGVWILIAMGVVAAALLALLIALVVVLVRHRRIKARAMEDLAVLEANRIKAENLSGDQKQAVHRKKSQPKDAEQKAKKSGEQLKGSDAKDKAAQNSKPRQKPETKRTASPFKKAEIAEAADASSKETDIKAKPEPDNKEFTDGKIKVVTAATINKTEKPEKNPAKAQKPSRKPIQKNIANAGDANESDAKKEQIEANKAAETETQAKQTIKRKPEMNDDDIFVSAFLDLDE